MKLLNPFRKQIKSYIASKKIIEGFVEHIEPDRISGWVIHKKGEAVSIELRIKGISQSIQLYWVGRPDVAEQYGLGNIHCGFEISLPEEARLLMAKDAANLNPSIEVLANKTSLPILGIAKPPKLTGHTNLRLEKLNITSKRAQFDANLSGIGHFTVHGCLTLKQDSPLYCDLLCNDQTLECKLILVERAAHTAKDNIGILKAIQFEVELPGYLWEAVGDIEPCQLIVRFNHIALNTIPLRITRQQASQWIQQVVQMKDNGDKQYRMLLALEHARYGRFFSQLDAKTTLNLANFADKMKLADWASGTFKTARSDIPQKSPGALTLWNALTSVNQRIDANPERVFEAVAWATQNLALSDKDRNHFLRSLLPLLCKSDELLPAKDLLDLDYYEKLANSRQVWEISLAVPVLLAYHQTEKATTALHRTIGLIKNGWLNTSCIYFSLKLVHQFERDLEITASEAENFRHAVITLLDSLQGEWFSRLHDHDLIASLAHLVAHCGHYSDYHRKDIIAAVPRLYGMNPAFWRQLDLAETLYLNADLSFCRTQFDKLSAYLNQVADASVGLNAVYDALSYFGHHKNSEAVMFLREVVAQHLNQIALAKCPEGLRLIQALLNSDPHEAIRLAAFPLQDENGLFAHFLETGPEKLKETLRQASDQHKGITSSLQEQSSHCLNELLKLNGATGVANEAENALNSLFTSLMGLDTGNAQFLAFDLLSTAYPVAREQGLDCQRLLAYMAKLFDKAIERNTSDGYLPTPIVTGLANLTKLNAHAVDSRLRTFIARCHELIDGTRKSRIPTPNTRPRSGLFEAIGWPGDTLVVIYSCRKYLDTRIKTIRETWAQDLLCRNIPYLIVVGDGDDSVQGDILALDVSDHYEHLPQKTLKLFAWVHEHTNVEFVLKIDDDCYLDVDRFFDSLSYRKHPYYGRVIRRPIGGTDRLWHQKKSHGLLGQKSIDKSPEPSIYADGGGGYTLSRLAVKQLLDTSQRPEGKRLIMQSFMEDKLVGDLLALNDIRPSSEDYEAYQRRRTFDKAMPVAMVENTFFPSQCTPTKTTHLDSDKDFGKVRAQSKSSELWPKKIWPTYQAAAIKFNSNQLELLTDLAKLDDLMAENLVLIAVIRNEMTLLPHFLAHYRQLGVRCFTVIDNCSDDGSREYLFGQPDVILFSSDTEYKNSHYGVAWQQAVLGNFCLGKWVLLADADEFLVYDDCENRQIQQLLAELEVQGCDAVCVYMVDMYPEGNLDDADFTVNNPFESAPLFDVPPVTPWHLGSGCFSNCPTTISHLRHRVVPNAVPNDFVSQKYPLFKYAPWVRLSEGIHYATNLTPHPQPCWFAHFKYHAGFKAKVETEIRRKQHFNNAAEYQRYEGMMKESSGQFFHKNISRRYNTSHDFTDSSKPTS